VDLLLVIVIVALLADRWLMQRQHSKHRMEWEQAFRLERTALLQRIQAPEIAVLPENPESAPYVAPDDDEAFWAAQEDRDA
jgi:hypothetical protein